MSDTFKSVLKQAKCLNCGAGLSAAYIKTRLCPACERDLERSSRLTPAKPRQPVPPHVIDAIVSALMFLIDYQATNTEGDDRHGPTGK